METKNYGVNLELEEQQSKPEDWVFGVGSQKCFVQIPIQEREQYLPRGEHQAIGQEKMDCASRSPVNLLAEKFTYAYKNRLFSVENRTWLEKNGYVQDEKVDFSDRHLAILSGTTKSGNSLRAPVETLRSHKDTSKNIGLIPKLMFPQVNSWDEYYDKSKITPKMIKLGKEFLEHFTIKYDKVYDFLTGSREDLICVAGYAWPQPINGIYPRVDHQPNHAFMVFKPEYFAFDNYLDRNRPEDWIKQLATDYKFYKYGYRIFINENTFTQRITLMQKILELLKKILGLDKQIIEIIEKKTPPMPEPVVDPEPWLEPTQDEPKPTQYLWATKEQIISSIKKIAMEMDVDPELARRVAKCESGYILTAVCQNKGSRDRGLYQWNDYYHPDITDKMAFDPEISCRLFCKAIKNGRLSWWSASRACWDYDKKYLA